MIATMPTTPTDSTATVLTDAVYQLLDDLRAAGISDPLSATISVGALIADLYRAAAVPFPIGLACWSGDTDTAV